MSSLITQIPVSLHFPQSRHPEIFFLDRTIFSTSPPASFAPARAWSKRTSLFPPPRGLPRIPNTFIFLLRKMDLVLQNLRLFKGFGNKGFRPFHSLLETIFNLINPSLKDK